MLDFGEKSFTNGVTTLVALLVVNGRKAEAEKVAADARQEWDDSSFHAAIDKALQGNVPEPWPPSDATTGSSSSGASASLGATAGPPSSAPTKPGQWQPPENPDPTQILKEAQVDASGRRYEVALAKFVWYHENALRFDPAQTGVRSSSALGAWKKLADDYPPALVKLKATRDAAMAQVKAGSKVGNPFFDLTYLNRALGEESLTRDAFLWVHEHNPKEGRRAFIVAAPVLIRAKDYKLCGEYIDSAESSDRLATMFRMNKRLAAKQKSGDYLLRHAEKSFTNGIATLVALLVVNDRKPEAEKVVADAKKEWDDASFLAAIEKALQGNVPEPWPN